MSAEGGVATSDKLSKLIASLGPEKRGMLAELLREPPEPIAIVGMSCRFAGADSPDALWRALNEGFDGITRVPKSRWDVDALLQRSPELAPTAWGGFIDEVDKFEPGVFGISPREAIQIDPQQRLILEGVWEALEDAGLPLEAVAGTATGVFIGACGGGEYASLCARDPQAVGSHTGTGVSNNMLAGRVSYVFDLHGPSVVVDTACSSSLVAVHLASESLRRRETAVAIVGGVNLVLSPEVMRMMLEMQLLAPDGRCKAFDARADGIARGEGCGVVVLKRLGDAIADRDRVIAIVRGTAVNQDGRSNGLTAPTGVAQREVIERALAVGRVAPAEVGYVEAHGTGTALGDPIEVEALKEVLSRGRGPGDRCVLGSLKANLGHTEGAAGIAGFIKTALSLSRGVIPPQINFRRLNPHIALENTPFVVSREPLAWPADGKRWIAGVSSFGWSGTNAHAVLEAPPLPPPDGGQAAADGHAGRAMMLPISARSPAALRALADRWSAFLARDTQSLADLTYTATTRRSHHRFRHLVVGTTRRDLIDGLRAVAAGEAEGQQGEGPVEVRAGAAERVVFVFPGQGSQWVGMSRGLLAEKAFREALEACDAGLRAFTGWSAIDMLTSDANAQRWKEVDVIQPLIFAMQVSLAALWRSWGIEPDAVVGHSLGEIAAAYVAGALDLADAARVIAVRSRLVRRTSGKGRMALAEIGLDEARSLVAPFGSRLSVAASNGPRTVLLSGEPGAVESALEKLQAREVFCRYVEVDYASHSEQMAPLAPELGGLLAGIRPRAGAVPIYSTVKAEPISGEIMDAAYWSANLREPVLFHPTVERLIRDGRGVFLEISPHPVLVPSIENTLSAAGVRGAALASTRRNQDERGSLLATLASLYALGRSIDWKCQFETAGRSVSLPTYAWQRETYWPARTGRRTDAAIGLGNRLLAGDGLTLPDGTRVWEAELSATAFPYLADHRVGGMVIFPAAGYVEMALEAARVAFGWGATCVVQNLRLEQMLELPAEGGRVAQLLLMPRHEGPGTFQIGSPSSAGWSVHASGELRAGDDLPAASSQPPAEIAARCPHVIAVDEFYEGLRLGGIDLGTGFRRLEEMVAGAGEALARIRSADPSARGAAGGEIDPTLLDACFQVIGGAMSAAASGSFMPVAIGAVVARARPEGQLSVHARIADETAAGDRPRGDVFLLGEDGRVFVEVRDLQLQRVGASRRTVDEWMFGIDWEPQGLPAASTSTGTTWLALGDEALAGALRQHLEAVGDRLVFSPDAAHAAGELAGPVQRDVGGIVYLAPEVGDDAMAEGAVETCVRTLALVRALVDAKLTRPPRLWLVTRGAQAVDGQPVSPALAAVWGLGRTIPHEHPELRCACVDLAAAPEADDLAALAAELRSEGGENQVALRGRERSVPRLTRARPRDPQPAPAHGRPFRLVSDGLRAFARRQPGTGQVEVEVSAATLDRAPGRPAACSGRIVAVGPDGAAGFAVGESVAALLVGEPATHVVVEAGAVVRLPPGLSPEIAAATLPLVAAAHHAVIGLARAGDGESVLISDGASAEGRASALIAAAAGAEVVALGGTAGESFRTIPPGSSPAEAQAANGGRRFDVVVGTGAPWDDFSEPRWSSLLAPLGRWVGGPSPIEAPARRPGPGLGASTPANVSRLTADLLALAAEAPSRLRATLEGAGRHLGDLARTVEVHSVPIGQAQAQPGAAARGRGPITVATFADPEVMIATHDTGPAIAAAGTYLVTGGLGGLGLEVARWLVARGARHLALVGRSDPSPQARDAIALLAADGAEVVASRCDVAEPRDMARLLERIRTEMPPLRGIIHAAGVLDDGVLMHLDSERFARVMAPKVGGAWNLHTLTRAISSLDFLVMFSSTSAVLGSPGQANYAAANAFLDGLAHLRAAAGLPGTSIDWGTWRGVGLAAAQDNRGERMARKGVIGLSPAEGIAALERVMGFSPAQIAVTRFSIRSRNDVAGLPIFARFLSEIAPQAAPSTKVRDEIAALAPSERRYRLETYVKKEIAGLLRLPLAAVDAAASLNTFGFDSLMALELRNRLDTRFGLRLSPTVLWARRSIDELVPYLADLMGLALDQEPAPTEAPVALVAAPTAADLLPDDQIEAALLAKLDLLDRREEDHA